jgi:hypothetical protein
MEVSTELSMLMNAIRFTRHCCCVLKIVRPLELPPFSAGVGPKR